MRDRRYQVFTPTSGDIWETQFSNLLLIHRRRDEIDAFLQKTFSNAVLFYENVWFWRRIGFQLQSAIQKHAANVLLTHWGSVTHNCISKLSVVIPDKGLSRVVPSLYLKQHRLIIDLAIRIKFK